MGRDTLCSNGSCNYDGAGNLTNISGSDSNYSGTVGYDNFNR